VRRHFWQARYLNNIMDQYAADIGHGALPDLEWHAIDGVSTFLRALR
jgi:hypothetical protein